MFFTLYLLYAYWYISHLQQLSTVVMGKVCMQQIIKGEIFVTMGVLSDFKFLEFLSFK